MPMRTMMGGMMMKVRQNKAGTIAVAGLVLAIVAVTVLSGM